MINIGDSYAELFLITPEIILAFANVSGDKNPIHLDREYAEKTVFNQPIAHGMLIGSFISNVLGNKLPGNGTIFLKQELNFLAPVFVGDTVEVLVQVIQKKETKPIYTLNTICKVGDKEVVSGYALVKYE